MSPIVVCSLLLLFCIADEVISKPFTDLQMFDKVINDLPDDNVIICPPAIDLALIQIYLAAGGATETKLKDTAAISRASKETICKNTFPSWASELKTPIRIVSRFYAHKDAHIQPTYKSTYTKCLSTEIENVEASDKWAGTVNRWVTSHTDKDLENLIDPLEVEDSRRVFLTSALSFSLSWEVPFKPIADDMFYVPDESRSATVKMMQVVGSFKYNFETAIDCHTLLIPFSKLNLDMVLLIPRSSDGISKIEKGLTKIDISKVTARSVNLSLPEFKFRYNRDMVQTLIDLGVDGSVFGNTNLSDLIMYNEKFKIDSVTHSSIVQVDATGINSAFATGVDVLSSTSRTDSFWQKSASTNGRKKRSPRASKPPPSVIIEVNRPFLFALRDVKRTYFFGRYSYPA